MVQVHPGPPFKSLVNTRLFSLLQLSTEFLQRPFCQPFVNFRENQRSLLSGTLRRHSPNVGNQNDSTTRTSSSTGSANLGWCSSFDEPKTKTWPRRGMLSVALRKGCIRSGVRSEPATAWPRNRRVKLDQVEFVILSQFNSGAFDKRKCRQPFHFGERPSRTCSTNPRLGSGRIHCFT